MADIFGKQNSQMLIEKAEADIRIELSRNSSPVIERALYPLMLVRIALFIKFKDCVWMKQLSISCLLIFVKGFFNQFDNILPQNKDIEVVSVRKICVINLS